MMGAELDPSIILQGQDPMAQQQRALQLNALRMRAQQEQQQQADAMALRDIFSKPEALDPKTGEPTGQTLNQIMRINPQMGMQVSKSVLAAQKGRADLAQSSADLVVKKQGLIQDQVRSPALSAYDEAKAAGLPEQVALDAGQKVFSDGLSDLEKTGQFSDEEKAKFPRKFDPMQVRARDLEYQGWKAKQDDQKKARELETKRVGLEGRTVDLAGAREARAEREEKRSTAGVPLDGDALDEAAHDYRKTGKLPPGVNPSQISQIIGRAGKLRKSGDTSDVEVTGALTQLVVKDPATGKESSVAAERTREGNWVRADNKQPIKGEIVSTNKEQRDLTRAENAKAGLIDDETADRVAEQYLGGDHSSIRDLGYGFTGPTGINKTKVMDLVTKKMKERDLTPGQVNALQFQLKADGASQTQLTKLYDNVTQYAGTMENNIKLAEGVMKKGVGPTGLTVVDSWIRAGRQATNDPDVIKLNNYIDAIVGESAKINSGSMGNAAATDSSRLEARQRVNKAFDVSGLSAAFEAMRNDAKSRTDSLAERIKAIPGRAAERGSPASATAAPADAKPATEASAGKFEEGKVYRDAKGNKARFQGGTWVPVVE